MEKKVQNRILINPIFYLFILLIYNFSMKNIICISGKQYSGKDTLAKILLENLPNFKRVGIGDSIKIEYGKIHNLTFDVIEKNKSLYRTGLIELGDKGRKIDPDFWLKKILELDYDVIIPDVRLIHEIEIFKQYGAYLIRVESSFETRSKRGVITNANDLTETALDDYKGFNYVIENNSDFNCLIENSKPLLKILKTKF